MSNLSSVARLACAFLLIGMSATNPLARLEAYSDGIFAIASTLLVLEIRVPTVGLDAPASELWRRLAELWPSYLAFALSFGTILIMWVNHHSALQLLNRTSKPFIYANGLLLLAVTFVPFPTALLARYFDTEFAAVAVVSYSAYALLTNVVFVLWGLSMQRPVHLFKPEVNRAKITDMNRKSRLGLLVYVLTTAVSWWLPALGLALIIALYAFWASMSVTIATET